MVTKGLIIAVLATFCLTSTLFMIQPTRSNPGVGEYDPWVDLKEDGTIDIYDAIILGNAYGTSGDPTKNVNVTNWPQDRQPTIGKRTQRIIVLESLSNGVYIAPGLQDYAAFFIFDFEPLGQLVNVTNFYVNWVMKAPDNNGYFFNWTMNFYYNYLEIIDHAANPIATWNQHFFLWGTEIHEGINDIGVWNGNPAGNLILYRLEVFIQYYSIA